MTARSRLSPLRLLLLGVALGVSIYVLYLAVGAFG